MADMFADSAGARTAQAAPVRVSKVRPPIDQDVLSRDVRSGVAAQVDRQVRDIFGLSQAFERDALGAALLVSLGGEVVCVSQRVEVSGRDVVYGDVVRTEVP